MVRQFQLSLIHICIGHTCLLLAAQDSKQKEEVGKQLHAACRDVGFFYVSNHGEPDYNIHSITHMIFTSGISRR